jgi:hypothetical protein
LDRTVKRRIAGLFVLYFLFAFGLVAAYLLRVQSAGELQRFHMWTAIAMSLGFIGIGVASFRIGTRKIAALRHGDEH